MTFLIRSKKIWAASIAILIVASLWGIPVLSPAKEPAVKAVPIAAGEEETAVQQFRGVVEPGQRVRYHLLPGERVLEAYVAQDDRVKQGTPLFRMANDALSSALAALMEKQERLKDAKEELSLLKLEIKLKDELLGRLNAKIEAENKTAREVAGYVSTRSEILEERRYEVLAQLELLRARQSVLEKKTAQARNLETLLDEQMKSLDRQHKALLVKAPFDGQVVYLYPQPDRVPMGGPVMELWDDSFLLVRGEVMQHQLKYVTPGSKVEVTLDFTAEKPVQGVVSSVERTHERIQTGAYPTFQIIIRINTQVDWLEPGMTVSVRLDETAGQTKAPRP